MHALASPLEAAKLFANIRNRYPNTIQYQNATEDLDSVWDSFLDNYKDEMMAIVTDLAISHGKPLYQATTENARLFHMLHRWAQFGMPVFKLTRDLLASLVMTDPSNVQCDEVQFPFPTFCIKLPDDFWWMDGFPMEVVWVHRFISVRRSSEKKEQMLHISGLNSDGMTLWDNSAYNLGTDICPPGDASDQPLKGWIGRELNTGYYVSEEMGDEEYGLVHSIKRLVVNLLLYISEKGKGDPQGKTKKYTKRSKKLLKDVEPQVWMMGSHVRMKPQVIEAAMDAGGSSDSPSDRARWKLTKRIVVKGHWRRQPIGKRGMGQWKWKWIEPYPKGEGPRLTHIYEDQPRRPKKNPQNQISMLEERAQEAADQADACYRQGLDADGDFHSDRANAIYDALEELTGEEYD